MDDSIPAKRWLKTAPGMDEKKLESLTHRDHRGRKAGPMLAASVMSGGPNGLQERGRIGAKARLEAANG